LLQQALLHVLQPAWDKTFSDHSDGFRPKRSAHQATARAQQYLKEGDDWVVDLDLEKVFDRVHQDKLMSLVKGRIADRRVSHLIDRDLKAGVLTGDGCAATGEGTPQGGPRSPLVANLLLDRFDKELDRRGHRFVRDADESNISVQSLRAGQRVLASVPRFLERPLQRTVNAAKSAVDRPWRRTFLGFTFTRRRPNRRLVSAKALKALKQEGRQRTCRTRGVPFRRVVQDLRQDLNGWSASVRCAAGQSIVKERDSWVRRRRRCSVWKQWGRHRYRELRRRGVRQDLAWHTGKSAHGPWRFSRSPALAMALPGQHFARLGVPRLPQRSRR
jgi:group II intron reverse transcriptase/maturase